MGDTRIIRVGPHALTLLSDILENVTARLGNEIATFLQDDFSLLAVDSGECFRHYFVGFEDHVPFGYIAVLLEEWEAEIRGPYIYPDYAETEFEATLVRHALAFIREKDVKLAFCLLPSEMQKMRSTLIEGQFEELSDNPDFIKRWRDGILADRRLPSQTTLFAHLIEKKIVLDDSE